MCKKLQSMVADTPLVKNQGNPDYMRIILNGKKSLEELFAEISQRDVKVKMQEVKKLEAKIPRKILLFVRQKETMAKLLYLETYSRKTLILKRIISTKNLGIKFIVHN